MRDQITLFQTNNAGAFPAAVAGNGTWGEIVGPGYLRTPPVNSWVGGLNERVIALGVAPDAVFQNAHGWIFDPATGSVWAGSFDALDEPIQP